MKYNKRRNKDEAGCQYLCCPYFQYIEGLDHMKILLARRGITVMDCAKRYAGSNVHGNCKNIC
jgi:hypothetical protein